MRIYAGFIGQDAQSVSQTLAARVVSDIGAVLLQKSQARVVFSTGATPVQTYALLREKYHAALSWERVCVQQLDEYAGLQAHDPRRFSTFLQRELVQPLGTRFSGLTGDESDAQLAALDEELARTGGIDWLLYGVGVNGHLGFNEPGSSFSAASRCITLHSSTRERIDTRAGPAPVGAVTLGLATLNAAGRIRVIALGAAKQGALTRGLLAPAGVDSPLSSLQTHADVQFFLDAAAAPAALVLQA